MKPTDILIAQIRAAQDVKNAVAQIDAIVTKGGKAIRRNERRLYELWRTITEVAIRHDGPAESLTSIDDDAPCACEPVTITHVAAPVTTLPIAP